jgi:DNA invertase Pin-like site-specific DNA recombinase
VCPGAPDNDALGALEVDLRWEGFLAVRVKSGLQAAKAKGVVLGRKVGQRPSDKKARKVLEMHREGLSYRLIGRNVGLSKNTVMDIVRRHGH